MEMVKSAKVRRPNRMMHADLNNDYGNYAGHKNVYVKVEWKKCNLA